MGFFLGGGTISIVNSSHSLGEQNLKFGTIWAKFKLAISL